jgi:hypothetical protein
MLTSGRAPAFAAADDLCLPVDKFAEQFQILVIDIHRLGPNAVNVDRIAPLHLGARLCLFASGLGELGWRRAHTLSMPERRLRHGLEQIDITSE